MSPTSDRPRRDAPRAAHRSPRLAALAPFTVPEVPPSKARNVTQATTAPSVPYDHLLDGPLLELTPHQWEALEDSLAVELDDTLRSTITFEYSGRDPRAYLELPVDLEETVAELIAQAHIGKARVAVPGWADPWTYLEAAAMAAFGQTATSTTPAGDGTWRLTWLLEDEV